MKFQDYPFDEGIHKSLEKSGFKKPTDIQFKSIPAILNGEDVLAIAQTGTGKTAAFVLPTLHHLVKRKATARAKAVRCVVMAPTHELAQQIHGVFSDFGKHTRIKAVCLHGGVDQAPQIAALSKGADVVIATPGRLFDLQSQGHLDLSRTEILVLDEADHMLDLGFINDIKSLLKFLPEKRQTLFFSATINKGIKKLAYQLISSKAIRIQISPKNPVSKNVEHAVAKVEMDDKRFFLAELINIHEEAKILVFVRTKVRAERVLKSMLDDNFFGASFQAATIHGDKSQSERNKALKGFKEGDLQLLITTDVSARGIDIPNVEFVVNYDLPEVPENYVHRVGRTGRGTHKGHAVSFCSSQEEELLKNIENILDKPIEQLEITKRAYKSVVEDFSSKKKDDWQSVIDEIELLENQFKSKKKGKRK